MKKYSLNLCVAVAHHVGNYDYTAGATFATGCEKKTVWAKIRAAEFTLDATARGLQPVAAVAAAPPRESHARRRRRGVGGGGRGPDGAAAVSVTAAVYGRVARPARLPCHRSVVECRVRDSVTVQCGPRRVIRRRSTSSCSLAARGRRHPRPGVCPMPGPSRCSRRPSRRSSTVSPNTRRATAEVSPFSMQFFPVTEKFTLKNNRI
jgi:hypothetical protein